jgi:hypothetical protein
MNKEASSPLSPMMRMKNQETLFLRADSRLTAKS